MPTISLDLVEIQLVMHHLHVTNKVPARLIAELLLKQELSVLVGLHVPRDSESIASHERIE